MEKNIKKTKNVFDESIETTQETELRKKQKTRKRLLLSVGGIVITTSVVVALSVGITIAKKEVTK